MVLELWDSFFRKWKNGLVLFIPSNVEGKMQKKGLDYARI